MLAAAQDFSGGVASRHAHDAASGMGGGAAEIEAAHRRPISGVTREGTKREELIRDHRALEDVAAGEIERPLEVERGEHLAREDGAAEVRRVLVEQREAPVGEA